MPHPDLLLGESLPAEILQLISDAPIPGLLAEPCCAATRDAVASLLRTETGQNALSGTLIESALWLLSGELDRSHTISQAFDSSEGSYWHGIMHRREGDFSNAKYWCRRTGTHRVHHQLAELMSNNQQSLPTEIVSETRITDPEQLGVALVDLVQQAAGGKASWSGDLEQVCWWEWQLLFLHCL